MSDYSPNILFITCHDLGRHLGCYGNPTVTSPALDALAEQGVRFDNAFATAPTCCPARAALHTGRYPHSTGMLGFLFDYFYWSLHESERHLASLLGQRGYATAQIGYQHVVRNDRLDLRRELGFERILDPGPNPPAEAVAADAVKFLSEYRDDRPFYLEVGFFEAHTRWDRNPRLGWDESDATRGVEVPEFLPDDEGTRAQFAGYQGAIRKLDEGVGAVLAALDAAGLAQDTLVIFVTDHGMPFPAAKGTLYDPGIEIALLMRWPGGGVAGGKAQRQLISNVDVVPTVLEAVGAPVHENVQGLSFWPLLADGEYRQRQEVFAEMTFGIHYEPIRAVRTHRHKLLFVPEMSPSLGSETDGVYSPAYRQQLDVRPYYLRPIFELYDLEADPLERDNLAGAPQHAETELELKKRLRVWMETTEDPLLAGPVASPRYHRAMAELRQE